eukprot:RCo005405
MTAEKGKELMKKAEKKLNSICIFGNKYEDAKPLFLQAANQFKGASLWEEAGRAFIRASECCAKLKEPLDTADNLAEAAAMYKKVNPLKAAGFLQEALDTFDKSGRFSKSAKLSCDLAETFEKDGNLDSAMEWYLKASDYYRSEGSTSTSNGCRLKVAEALTQKERYEEANRIFEDVADHCITDALLRTNCKGYYFAAMLNWLALGNADQAQAKFSEYTEKDLNFDPLTREHMFVQGVLQAFEEKDLAVFDQAFEKFNSILPFEPARAAVVQRIKQRLENPNMT